MLQLCEAGGASLDDVEPVFGNIKYNKGFKRFILKGCDKVEIEAGLISIARNLKKWSC